MTCRRDKLANRRQDNTVDTVFNRAPGGPLPLTVSIGLAEDRKTVTEVFISMARPQSELALIADDFAVLISLLLQRGAAAGEIAHLLGRDGTARATIAGHAADLLVAEAARL